MSTATCTAACPAGKYSLASASVCTGCPVGACPIARAGARTPHARSISTNCADHARRPLRLHNGDDHQHVHGHLPGRLHVPGRLSHQLSQRLPHRPVLRDGVCVQRHAVPRRCVATRTGTQRCASPCSLCTATCAMSCPRRPLRRHQRPDHQRVLGDGDRRLLHRGRCVGCASRDSVRCSRLLSPRRPRPPRKTRRLRQLLSARRPPIIERHRSVQGG